MLNDAVENISSLTEPNAVTSQVVFASQIQLHATYDGESNAYVYILALRNNAAAQETIKEYFNQR